MAKISTSFITNEVVHPQSGQLLIQDDELKGVGLRVTKNCIAFIVERRISGKVRRTTIGKHGPITPEEARQKAQQILSEKFLHQSNNRAMILSTTLAEVLTKFLAIRKLRPNTVRSYSQITKRCLGDWLDTPIANISKEMVQARHSELTRCIKQRSTGEMQASTSFAATLMVKCY